MGKLGRAKMLLVVLVLMGPREGLDLGPGSMGPAIDHEGLDRGLECYRQIMECIFKISKKTISNRLRLLLYNNLSTS